MEDFLDRIPAKCYLKEHSGAKTPYRETPCLSAEIKRFVEETVQGSVDPKYPDHVVRGRSEFGHVHWTQRKGADTLVFRVSHLNLSMSIFYFAKYKVVFRPR